MNWNATKEEYDLMARIADRAEALYQKQGVPCDRADLLMDINAVHSNGCPLRLEELLNATDFDFSHDIAGIEKHLDRTTGKLSDGFWPRYAR